MGVKHIFHQYYFYFMTYKKHPSPPSLQVIVIPYYRYTIGVYYSQVLSHYSHYITIQNENTQNQSKI